ncbi:MAG TPA: hypothetical protein VN031_03590 [Candidatus Microsaccharimonas sp.]|nr:hypothetical protein [Candidatus Microsaccharimonas sp.]
MAETWTNDRDNCKSSTTAIFDIYAQKRLNGELPNGLNTIRYAGIIAAEIEHEWTPDKEWPVILDERLATRGVMSHYADMSRRDQKHLVRMASNATSKITHQARTLSQHAEALRLALESEKQ